MRYLTRQERYLIAFVLAAVLAGAVTKYWRDRAMLDRDRDGKEKIADERTVDRE
ncbi:MAG: hypothetical protein AAF591_13100 [Verrucomicrobiota bacterium]